MGIVHKIRRSGHLTKGNWAFLRNWFRGGRIDSPPVFILGCGHSGTSLLLRILGSHSQIYSVPYESRVMFKGHIRIRLLTSLWAKCAIAEGKTRWVEKTPIHIRYIGRILKIFPDARILLVIRDGRDVALSLRKRWNNFNRAVTRWVEDNRSGQQWWDHPQVYKVTYEELVSSFETSLHKVCGFLNIPYEPQLADFYHKPAYIFSKQIGKPASEFGADHKHYRNWQINQKLFNGSGKWRTELSEEEKVLFKEKAGQMLIDYGYAQDFNW